MQTKKKQDLIDRVAQLTEQRRFDVKRTITRFLEVMVEELSSGNRIELREFGIFENRGRKGRTAQNPRTGASITVPPRRTVKFKASRQVRERLERAGAPPEEREAEAAAPVALPSPAAASPGARARSHSAQSKSAQGKKERSHTEVKSAAKRAVPATA